MEFPVALSDPGFLSSRTWNGDKVLEAMVQKWPVYNGEQGFPDETVLHSVQIVLLGSTLTAQYRVSKTDSLTVIVVQGEQPGDACPTFVGWATTRLGKFSKVIDLSIQGQENAFANVKADWLLGQTRVRLTCFAVKAYGEWIPGLVALQYAHKDTLPAFEDLVYIECTSTKKYVGNLTNPRVEETAPLTFIIDPNARMLLRRDGLAFLETKKYSDEEIVAARDDEKGNTIFKLDRVTGGYQSTIRLKGDSRTGIDQWGKCTRIDPGRRF
jgi:hypothetical protein